MGATVQAERVSGIRAGPLPQVGYRDDKPIDVTVPGVVSVRSLLTWVE